MTWVKLAAAFVDIQTWTFSMSHNFKTSKDEMMSLCLSMRSNAWFFSTALLGVPSTEFDVRLNSHRYRSRDELGIPRDVRLPVENWVLAGGYTIMAIDMWPNVVATTVACRVRSMVDRCSMMIDCQLKWSDMWDEQVQQHEEEKAVKK